MLYPTSSVYVCCPRATLAFYTQHCPTVCYAQGPWWHATLNTVLSCVLSKGNDIMPCSTSSNCVCKTRGNVKLNGIQTFYHKIDYLTFKKTFSDVLPRYNELKNIFSFIIFVALKNYIFFQNIGKFKIEWVKRCFWKIDDVGIPHSM